MKKLILFFFVLSITGTTLSFAQERIPAQHYSKLMKDYNDANNEISRTYKRTGYLPAGWRDMSVAELCQLMGANDLWMEFDVAAPHNRQVNNGIFMSHHERMLIDSNGQIYCAVTCSNKTVRYKFIYADTCISCCYGDLDITVNVRATSSQETTVIQNNTVQRKGYSYSVSYN